MNIEIRASELVKEMCEDRNVVYNKGGLLSQIGFNSPYTLVQFVKVYNSNGYRVWKVDDKATDVYLRERGLR